MDTTEYYSDTSLGSVVSAIADAVATIAIQIRTHSTQAVGSTNEFGDAQLAIDIFSDNVIFESLRKCGHVESATSEEKTEIIDMGGHGFTVAFDPLDGSSIIDTNFSVGTIFGIWPGNTIIGKTGREQVAAGISVYGPRTTLLLSTDSGVHEFTLHENEAQATWINTRSDLKIAESGKLFAPGNLRAIADNPGYNELVQFWMSHGYTLRYTGGMVPDVFQLFIKGKGVFSNASSPSAVAKLRLAYECAPVAFLVERAGGKSSDGEASILDRIITNTSVRTQICLGSTQEVDRFDAMVGRAI